MLSGVSSFFIGEHLENRVSEFQPFLTAFEVARVGALWHASGVGLLHSKSLMAN
jgi:hypothetical protein